MCGNGNASENEKENENGDIEHVATFVNDFHMAKSADHLFSSIGILMMREMLIFHLDRLEFAPSSVSLRSHFPAT